MRIEEILAEKVIQDYYTANIKAEVILDMILTPVISEILTAVGRENRELGINGEMKLIAKEFPMLNSKSCVKTGGCKYSICSHPFYTSAVVCRKG